jgi:mannose-6-phosphate isomerase
VTIEHASMQAVRKPWGSTNLRPWSEIRHDGSAIGELWYERADTGARSPALLLKLLFTKEALSIQVHPDDTFAQSIGLTHGKTETWYILSAMPGAQVAVGLKERVTTPQLRASVEDGSIMDLFQWRQAQEGDVIFIPAGTIHAIGPGLVIAEIQQRCDATFRLFDYGSQRELHIDNAVAVARAEPAEGQAVPALLTDARTLLVASEHFVLERIDLASQSNWHLHAEHETWLLVLEGRARIGQLNTFAGEAIYLEKERARIAVGRNGLSCLVAYLALEPNPGLSREREQPSTNRQCTPVQRPPLVHRIPVNSPVRAAKER